MQTELQTVKTLIGLSSDKTAPLAWFGSALFAQTYLSENIWIIINCSYVLRFLIQHMSSITTKPENDLCSQRRLRSAWASAQSDQSSLSAWRNIGPLTTYWVRSEDWLGWADAQADLSLRWAQRSFCCFCRAAAHIPKLQTVHLPLFRRKFSDRRFMISSL